MRHHTKSHVVCFSVVVSRYTFSSTVQKSMIVGMTHTARDARMMSFRPSTQYAFESHQGPMYLRVGDDQIEMTGTRRLKSFSDPRSAKKGPSRVFLVEETVAVIDLSCFGRRSEGRMAPP